MNRSKRERLASTCYLPVTSLLRPNYLPVILLFCVPRTLINPLETYGFRLILAANRGTGRKGG